MTPDSADAVAPSSQAIDRARALLAEARRVVVFTGAGVSAASGVPTFRGAGGLWRSFRPEELATPEAFARDPRLVWEWYALRRALVAECRPNAAHRAIARWAAAVIARGGSAVVATQNVDGLHQRAAAAAEAEDRIPAAPVLALHGSLFATRCSRCDWRAPEDDRDGAHVAGRPLDLTARETLPRCPRCGGLQRPGVVWFGEALDEGMIGAAYDAAARADACLAVGTSALVHPAAGIATAAARAGAAIVEVNADETPLTARATVSIRGRAAEVVPLVLGA